MFIIYWSNHNLIILDKDRLSSMTAYSFKRVKKKLSIVRGFYINNIINMIWLFLFVENTIITIQFKGNLLLYKQNC